MLPRKYLEKVFCFIANELSITISWTFIYTDESERNEAVLLR